MFQVFEQTGYMIFTTVKLILFYRFKKQSTKEYLPEFHS